MILSDRFAAAQTLALELHRDQLRKQTQIPYHSHLMAVAALILEHGGTEDQAIAGLLHDVIEDQGDKITYVELETRFGASVTAMVRECTDTEVTPKPPFIERKRAYHAHLQHASSDALLVSAADKLHNLQAVTRDYRVHGSKLWDRFVKDADSLTDKRDLFIWNHRALVGTLHARMGKAIRGKPIRGKAISAELVRQLETLEGLMRENGDAANTITP